MAANKKSTTHNAKRKRTMVERNSAAKKSRVVAEAGKTITVNRRENQDRRLGVDRRGRNASVTVERRVLERRVKVNRRRQIDPTTCERDYTQDEIEFMSAMDEYKRSSGRMFPTCSEVLEVIKSLGYEKRPQGEFVDLPAAGLPVVTNLPPVVTAASTEAW